MRKKYLAAALAAATAIAAGAAWATFANPRNPVVWYAGHSHTEHGETIDAPQHSGGTDRYGCHNASVPYHCH